MSLRCPRSRFGRVASVALKRQLYARKAMQGHGFLTADETIVVRAPQEGESLSAPLREVAQDGKEVGEICTRGNISASADLMATLTCSDARVLQRPRSDCQGLCRRLVPHGAQRQAALADVQGDLAVQYPDGTVSIQDRSKDIIISGGENASSLAIESALATHKDVFEVAVVARPHERFGERAHAFVVLVPDSAFHGRPADFEKELKEHCASSHRAG